ncbi:helix-turn-helix domain-containing protein [Micromonospora sp. NPDC003197]
MSDNDLGAFLRARREAVTPAEVGLPGGARRRTPGLRRSELATLANVSVEYLTRLEQGRDRNPSPHVIITLADALRLSADERLYLHQLVKAAGGAACRGAQPPVRSVRPTVQAMLDRFEPHPAFVINYLTEVLAFTTGYERIVGPIGLLDARSPSLARFVFTDTRARSVYPDWDRVADQQVAVLRIGAYQTAPHVTALTQELTVVAGMPFAERLAGPPVVPARTGVDRLIHPEVGELRLAYESLDLPGADGQQLVVYLPADDATSAALDRLTGRRPGALRMVHDSTPQSSSDDRSARTASA